MLLQILGECLNIVGISPLDYTLVVDIRKLGEFQRRCLGGGCAYCKVFQLLVDGRGVTVWTHVWRKRGHGPK